MDAVAAPDDPVAAWLRFGLERHGRVRVIGFRESHRITIELDRVLVPLWVYADRARKGTEPGARDDEDGLGHGARITLDEALAFASEGRTLLALIGYPGAGKTTLLRHLFWRMALGEVAGPTTHLRGLHPGVRTPRQPHRRRANRPAGRMPIDSRLLPLVLPLPLLPPRLSPAARGRPARRQVLVLG